MRHYRVVIEWKAAYENPIVLKNGEQLWLTGETEKWDGHLWVWAKNQAGKEGWIPNTLVREIDDKHYANEEFSALELTCRKDQKLLGIDEKHGWILCKAEDGSQGWVPAKNLEAI